MHLRKKMRRLAALLILMTCTMLSCGAENNLTMAEVPVEVPITADDDSEQELSSQLQEVDSRSGGWSSWSNWSACSRSCDGGVSHQLRTCRTGACRGDHVRYKICNMQSFVIAFAVVAVASAGNVVLPAGAVAYGAPLLRAPIVAAAPVAARVAVPAGSGLEGQYVPDNLERLYDDGSYRPELQPIPLSPSPYGLTPAGSGLEGQYVPDITEKLFDDGSYRPQLQAIPLSPSPYGLTPAGSGLEGQYVPDGTEHLSDDGSYKPGLYA